MRVLVYLSIALMLAYQVPSLYELGEQLFFGDADPHVRPAIALRCHAEPAGARAECEHALRRDFASGARQPEAIMRRHCTRFANRWAEDAEPPSPVCSELYGGWIEG
jgi:hypothetical protein